MAIAENLKRVSVEKVDSGRDREAMDVLAVEEPLEIRLGYSLDGERHQKAISITMRTPGDDFELATGFLFTEGIISSAADVEGIHHCGTPGTEGFGNTVRVDLSEGISVDLGRLERHFYTTSSCGVCGKSSIEALETGVRKLRNKGGPLINSEVIHRLPGILLSKQEVFERTGGLHASALFDSEGNLEVVREDVGRHNALDKVIGERFLKGKTRLDDRILLVSGRSSFELVQKALMAGIPVLLAVGSPSSLAVELSREYGMTMAGFVRDGRFNIYSGQERIG